MKSGDEEGLPFLLPPIQEGDKDQARAGSFLSWPPSRLRWG